MNTGAFSLGLLPILAFVLLYTFTNLNSALIGAIAFALLELVVSIVYFGEIDIVTGTSVFLVFVMAAMSMKAETDILFKFQPVILSIIFGVMLLVLYYSGRPLLYELLMKYGPNLPAEQSKKLMHPIPILTSKIASLYMGWGLIVYAAITALVALKLNKWWWLAMRAIGIYIVLVACLAIAQYSAIVQLRGY